MRVRPFRIGIYLNHLLTWQGGKEYARNLLLSLQAYRHARSAQIFSSWRGIGAFEVHLFAVDTLSVADLELFRPLAHALHLVPNAGVQTKERLFEHLKREKINFAFPIHAGNDSPIYVADWVFDLQHKLLPQFFSADDIQSRNTIFDEMLKHAWRVVVSSEATRRDLQRFYPGHDAMVRVLSFATFPKKEWIAGDPAQVTQRYHLPKRYFLVSSQLWMHKNHALVLRAVKKLADDGLEVDVVFTGPLTDYRKPTFVDETLAYIHEQGIFSRVRLMGLMPRLDQLQVMRCALAVVQPSLFEGWSTVLEDARTLGKKTLSSSLEVHLEQNLPDAEYFEPGDVDELARLMSALWKSDHSGFDPARETLAYHRAEQRTLEFARAFCRIAADSPLIGKGFWRRVKRKVRDKRRQVFGRRKRGAVSPKR